MDTPAFHGRKFAFLDEPGLMNLCFFIDYAINYSFVACVAQFKNDHGGDEGLVTSKYHRSA